MGTDGVGSGSTPLWLAARAVHDGEAGGAELAKLLVKKHANVNAVGAEGDGNERPECAPLWWAARAVWRGEAGGLELATLLVKKGADVNAVGTYWDGKEHTPLRWAALAAGAYTRPLLTSTLAVLVSEPFYVQFVTSYDPSIY